MITSAIVLLTVLVSLMAFQNQETLYKLIFNPYTIQRNPREWFRFLSAGFIHADFVHLAINMLVLYSFGKLVEEEYKFHHGPIGALYYILMYLSSIAFASLSSYFK